MNAHLTRTRAAWNRAFEVPGRVGRISGILALLAPAAAAAALVPFRSDITDSALALVMVAVVVLVVVPGRRVAALVAGISAGLWFDFFLTRPYESFTITHSADIQTAVLLVVVAVAVGELAARDRHHRTESVSSGDCLAAVEAVAELVDGGATADAVTTAVCNSLVSLLRLESCYFDGAAKAVTIPFIERPGYVSYMVYRWDAASEGLPVSPVTLPVRNEGRLLGRFVLQGPMPGVRLDRQRLVTAVVLSDLAGLALSRAQPERTLAPAS